MTNKKKASDKRRKKKDKSHKQEKRITQYINQLPDNEKAVAYGLLNVIAGGAPKKPISGDLELWRRKPDYVVNRKVERRYASMEPIASNFSNSDKQPDNPKPDNQPQEPDYDEPQPIKIDERLLDEYSDEIEKYLDNVESRVV